MSEPTDDEIRVAIAEFCGWTEIACTVCGTPGFVANNPEGDTLWRSEGGHKPKEAILLNCPDYLHDLNAIRLAEGWIPNGDTFTRYIRELSMVCGGGESPYTAPAEMRAIALYRVIKP